MCGIAGFVSDSVDIAVLDNMLAALHHRGPDDAGVFIEAPIALGHARLSIVDLAGGHQPMTNEDDTLSIVFNGEIFNYPELTDDLIQRGHVFRTRSDTEVILHLLDLETALSDGTPQAFLRDNYTSGDGSHLNSAAYHVLDGVLQAALNEVNAPVSRLNAH